MVTLIDDNTLEPVEEGFRLVLVVDESRTRRSLVAFDTARQIALFRINDYMDSESQPTRTYVPYNSKFLWSENL